MATRSAASRVPGILFVLAVLFYGVQLFLGTSRLSVAEIIGRLVRVFVILILVGTWSNFNDLVYDWLTTVPEAAGRAILAISLVVEPIAIGLAQVVAGVDDVGRRRHIVPGI